MVADYEFIIADDYFLIVKCEGRMTGQNQNVGADTGKAAKFG